MDRQTHHARALRKNMTKEERHLWYDFLRDYPLRFMRQRPIDRYIVDFYCAKAKLVIELDGKPLEFTVDGKSLLFNLPSSGQLIIEMAR